MIIFITGTGTNVGKTLITGLLARTLAKTHTVTTQKWVQTGSQNPDDILSHDQFFKSTIPATDKRRCPYQFLLPVSPHLAASKENQTIDLESLFKTSESLASECDMLLVEGSGGPLVPLTTTTTYLDLLTQFKWPTIIVSSIEVGAINHSLLTIDTLKHNGIPLLGIIGTTPTPLDQEIERDTLLTIERLGHVASLGHLPHGTTRDDIIQTWETCVEPRLKASLNF